MNYLKIYDAKTFMETYKNGENLSVMFSFKEMDDYVNARTLVNSVGINVCELSGEIDNYSFIITTDNREQMDTLWETITRSRSIYSVRNVRTQLVRLYDDSTKNVMLRLHKSK